jgi:hypothetical protein
MPVLDTKVSPLLSQQECICFCLLVKIRKEFSRGKTIVSSLCRKILPLAPDADQENKDAQKIFSKINPKRIMIDLKCCIYGEQQYLQSMKTSFQCIGQMVARQSNGCPIPSLHMASSVSKAN